MKDDGFSPSSVSKHCKNKNKLPYGGYYWKFLDDFKELFPKKVETFNPDESSMNLFFKNLSKEEKLKTRKYPEKTLETKRKISESNKNKHRKIIINTIPNFTKRIIGPDGNIYNSIKEASNHFNLCEKTIRKYLRKFPEKGYSFVDPDNWGKEIIDENNNIFENVTKCSEYYQVSKLTIYKWLKSKKHGLKYIDKN